MMLQVSHLDSDGDKNGQVTAVGKTISTKPKNLLGKKEGTKFVISGKQYVIKDIK